LKGLLNTIRNLIGFHKGKILIVLLCSILIIILRFPSDDLADFVTAKISAATGGAWYVQFDKMGFALLPFGIKTEKVVIESAALPAALHAESLLIKPWLLGAIFAKVGVDIDATGLFKGHLNFIFRDGEKLKSGERMKDLTIVAEDLALAPLFEFLRQGNMTSLDLHGSVNLDSKMDLDPLFDRQPLGQISVKMAGLIAPSQSFATQMGPIQTPTLKLGKLALLAKVSDGKIAIDELSFGSPNDDMNGKIKGDLMLMLKRDAMGVRPQMGAYDLKIELSVKKSFMDAGAKSGAGLAFMLIEKFKQNTPQGAKFAFRIKAANTMVPPEFLAL
jgi:type II secretion system protein N